MIFTNKETSMMDIVFIDIDGVLADFVGGTFELYNIPQSQANELKGSYDIINFLSVSVDSFWEKISDDTTFWEHLKPTEEAEQLIKLVERYVKQKQIFFLSSPAKNPLCHYGKAKWVQHHFPGYVPRLILTGYKYLLATPSRLLIDDSDSKVNKFRAHNGNAILMPRPWNSEYQEDNDYELPIKNTFDEIELLLGTYAQ